LEKNKINQFKNSMSLKRKMMNARLAENKPLEIINMGINEPKSIFNKLAQDKIDTSIHNRNN
jgi:hypothetical protein